MAPLLTLTLEEAVADLKALVKGREGFVYEPPYIEEEDGTICAYFDDAGVPSCIIGHLLSRHGVSAEDIDMLGVNINASVRQLASHEVLDAPEEVVELLESVQRSQDGKTAWGSAVTSALTGDQVVALL